MALDGQCENKKHRQQDNAYYNANLPDKQCNSCVAVVWVTNCFLSVSEVCSTGRTHTWKCKLGQKLMTGDIKDHRRESTSIWLSDHIVFSLFMFTPLDMCSQLWLGNLFAVGSHAERRITVLSTEKYAWGSSVLKATWHITIL